MPTKSNITIEGARLVFRNFTGKEGPYNPAGARSTGVLINEDMVDTLRADGWNIKWLKPKNEGDEEQTWEVGGKSGIKAYVKTMYVTIADDPFEAKYSNVSSREDDPPFDVD